VKRRRAILGDGIEVHPMLEEQGHDREGVVLRSDVQESLAAG
jgi:hypothetical protein